MRRNLFVSIILGAIACLSVHSARAQVSFNFMDTTNATIRFASPSSAGGLASITFALGGTLPKMSLITMVKATSSTMQNLPVRIQWCPRTNGVYSPAKAQTLALPTATSTQLPFVANGTGMMVLQYQEAAGQPWTSFDEVTVMDNMNNPVLNQSSAGGGTGYTFTYKSKDGTKGASVIVIVTSTVETPWMPPGHKK